MLLKILVEGDTEHFFVENILESYLEGCGYTVSAPKNKTSPGFEGGLSHYKPFKKYLKGIKKAAPKCILTTMIDLYGLPGDFPGKKDSANIQDSEERVLFLEEKLKEDLKISDFIPYIQLHEFEALLFSDINQIDQICGRDGNSKTQREQREKLKEILKKYGSPEQINHNMGPSGHLEKIYNKGFGKTVHGIEIAKAIGLDPMRKACPHFDQWLKELETQAGYKKL